MTDTESFTAGNPEKKLSPAAAVAGLQYYLCRQFLLVLTIMAGWCHSSTCYGVDVDLTFWGNDRGLPTQSVRTAVRTSEGLLLVGTANGLHRFDGITFSSLTGGPPGRVKHLEAGKSGTWVALLEAGSIVLGGVQGAGSRMDTGTMKSLPGNEWRRLELGPDGIICAQRDSGMVFFTSQGVQLEEVFYPEEFGSEPPEKCFAVSNGSWIVPAGRGGLWYLNGQSWSREEHLPADTTTIRVIYETSDGSIWLADSRGILYRRPGGTSWTRIPFGNGIPDRLPCASFVVTSDETIWLAASQGGLFCSKKKAALSRSISRDCL